MFDLQLRKLQERLFVPFAKLVGTVASPNQITFFAFLVGLLCCLSCYLGHNYLALGLFLLNRCIDALDGGVARLTEQQSDFGAHFDIITDFTLYALIPISMNLNSPGNPNILCILLATYYLNSASIFHLSSLLEKRKAGAALRNETTSITMPYGIVEGFETYLVYALLMLFPGYKNELYIVFSNTVFLNILYRCVWAYRELSSSN